jgi:hypothetical protein
MKKRWKVHDSLLYLEAVLLSSVIPSIIPLTKNGPESDLLLLRQVLNRTWLQSKGSIHKKVY